MEHPAPVESGLGVCPHTANGRASWDVPLHGLHEIPSVLPLRLVDGSIATRSNGIADLWAGGRVGRPVGTRYTNVCEFEREFARAMQSLSANTLEVSRQLYRGDSHDPGASPSIRNRR